MINVRTLNPHDIKTTVLLVAESFAGDMYLQIQIWLPRNKMYIGF